MHWRTKWQPTPVFLPGEYQGRGSLVGCRLGLYRVIHDCSDLAAAAKAAYLEMDHNYKLGSYFQEDKLQLLAAELSEKGTFPPPPRTPILGLT